MTMRQRRFAEVYRESGDPVKAVQAAGYREKNPLAAAKRLLALSAVQDALQIEEATARQAAVASEREVLEYLTQVLRCETGSDRERMRAAELLGKRHGLFSEKPASESASVIIVDDLGG